MAAKRITVHSRESIDHEVEFAPEYLLRGCIHEFAGSALRMIAIHFEFETAAGIVDCNAWSYWIASRKEYPG